MQLKIEGDALEVEAPGRKCSGRNPTLRLLRPIKKGRTTERERETGKVTISQPVIG